MYERKEKEILSEWDMINFKQRELERTEYVGDEKVRFLFLCVVEEEQPKLKKLLFGRSACVARHHHT